MSAFYDFNNIEKEWQKFWSENKTFNTQIDTTKPKFYSLDMFPYPSGAGLHVGHPLGYIASDIVSRYKRQNGFNVLHPMGYDSFGLPAEQYAIQTGQHPEITTQENTARYREQLDKIGFSFEWDREVKTSNPEYYKWTQWIFLKLFESWYNNNSNKAEAIESLISIFEKEGNANINANCDQLVIFTAKEWKTYSEKEQQQTLLNYRLTFLADTTVNWCPALGTVLANDEIKDGLSERGGHPVERKKMRQWSMRITAYAERLLQGLDKLDWTESIKEIQRNWIGRSNGAQVFFEILTPNPSPKERGAGYMTGNPLIAKKLLEFAQENRGTQTKAESILWEELRGKKLDSKFRRQHLIDNYIVDFVCLKSKLVIEVDGGYHSNPEQAEYDKGRTLELENLGYKEIRFSNEEVESNVEKVITKIKEELISRGEVLSSGEDLGEEKKYLEVFTTRPDTIFGATYMTIAPEHEWVSELTAPAQKAEVEAYVTKAKNRSERERMADVKTISGVFTGSFCVHPFTGEKIQIWIGDYVLATYGTGAVMAVPAHDSRDYAFAKHFNLPIKQVVAGGNLEVESYDAKEGKLINSDFLNGLEVKEAVKKAIAEIEKRGLGKGQINYKMRDAVFSRQRYWGEPIPIYFKDGLPYPIKESELPLALPKVEKYLPTETGEPPLGNAENWKYQNEYEYELSTMPGWAGSSWYLFRYMDPKNKNEFASKEALDYWGNVDLYIGGAEHATGHLLYSRFWTKFLYDRGFLSVDEPFQKMINQGMIQGRSNFVYRVESVHPSGDFSNVKTTTYSQIYLTKKWLNDFKNEEVSKQLKDIIASQSDGNFTNANFEIVSINKTPFHVDVNIVHNDELDIEAFKNSRTENASAEFILEEGKYICGWEVEKMSKSKYNVVTPDDVIEKYGADTLRMYEMFLGPLEQFKPWNTQGIDGVHKFLKRFWKLFFNEEEAFFVSEEEPTKAELKALHETIKKVEWDIENYSFNTSVSQFMILMNELNKLKCNKRAVLEPFVLILSPYAPHIAEELWKRLGHLDSISKAEFPKYNEAYLKEDAFDYPIMINGKMRAKISFPTGEPKENIEKAVLENEIVIKWLEGNAPKKVIVVPNKIVNIVL